MAIWALLVGGTAGLALGGPLGALAGAALGAAVDGVLYQRAQSPERRQVAFTIAAIALAAKMAKADGEVSSPEVELFQRLFHVPVREQANMQRFFGLAQQSVAGFESYARQAASLLGRGSPVLEDLLDALFLIAGADGAHDGAGAGGLHPEELRYLERVAVLFGFEGAAWEAIRARHLLPAADDPWRVLGLAPGADEAAIRAAYRALALRYHPDRHMAEGTPPEFIRVAEVRMAEINAAYRALTNRANRRRGKAAR